MKIENKILIKSTLLSGLVYAVLMAGFDYSDGQEFIITKFIINFTFFGLFMGLVSRYTHKKQMKNS